MIDVEFFGETRIIDAWADLFAHFRTDYKAEGVPEAEQTRRRIEKYATLLYEISQSLGYKIGRTHIRDDIYRPDIHNEFDEIELQTRRLTRDTLVAINAMDAIPVRFMPPQVDQVHTTEAAKIALPSPREPRTK
jgi:hypothetical protein